MSKMIEPPIDKLKEKMGDNAYRLVKVVANQAKKIENERPAEVEKSDKKAISLAADMVYEGKVTASDMVNLGDLKYKSN